MPPTAPPNDAELLTVIVPVYNEASTIDALLNRVAAAPYDKQVIVVDDGSTDGTAEALARWEGHPQLELLRHSRNRGKGAAVRTGLERACGRFTIIQDADLEYDPEDYPLLIEPLLSGTAQAVYGSRALNKELDGKRTWCLFRVGVKALNFGVRLLYGVRVTDEATCYKAFPTAVLRKMELACERFEFCPEVTAKAGRLGLHITEVPIRYQPRSVVEGKKIRWTDGMQAFATLWRWRKWRPSATTTVNAAKCAVASHASGSASGPNCWLSVVMPTYNGAAYLPATLDSLASQESRDFEVIAVDDGSTDDTVEILRSYASRLSLKIISRHLSHWPWSRPDLGQLSRIAWFSAELNLALMRKRTGQPVDWVRLCSHFLRLGVGGWHCFFRDSRIMDRGLSRLRVGLAGPGSEAALPRSSTEKTHACEAGGRVFEKGRFYPSR